MKNENDPTTVQQPLSKREAPDAVPSHPQVRPSTIGTPASPQRCRSAAMYVIELVDKFLIDKAEKNGGHLNIDEIRQVMDVVRQTPKGLWQFYKSTYEHCYVAMKIESPQDYERRDLYLRLLTETFAHHFPDTADDIDEDLLLPRSILRPFHGALEAMLGKTYLEQKRQMCFDIVDDLQRVQGDSFTWSTFYQDPRATEVLMQSCAALAMHFYDFNKRKSWLLGFLNSNRYSGNGMILTPFSEHHIEVLLTCLYDACHGYLARSDGDARLSQWVEESELNAIRNLVTELGVFGLFGQVHRCEIAAP